MNMHHQYQRDGFTRPVYVGLERRANLSRGGVPILEERRTECWATLRDLTYEEVCLWLGSPYVANIRKDDR